MNDDGSETGSDTKYAAGAEALALQSFDAAEGASEFMS